jgi:hypothetical protein
MSILVTVSVNMAESVTLRDLRQFVETAERNGADPDADLREYDENSELVGLAAVGELESGQAERDDVSGDSEGASASGDEHAAGEGGGQLGENEDDDMNANGAPAADERSRHS